MGTNMAYRAANYRRCQDKLTYPTIKAAEAERDRWVAMGYTVHATEAYKCPMCSDVHFMTSKEKRKRKVRP